MFYVTKVAFFSECFSQLKKCFCCSINSVLNFDLLYILYIDDEYTDMSEDKIELEDSDDHSIMLELEGNTVDVMTRQNVVEQESVLQLLKHDSTEWFLGNPDCESGAFMDNPNYGDMIDLCQNETPHNVLQNSYKHFGRSKDPLVIIRMYYVTKKKYPSQFSIVFVKR